MIPLQPEQTIDRSSPRDLPDVVLDRRRTACPPLYREPRRFVQGLVRPLRGLPRRDLRRCLARRPDHVISKGEPQPLADATSVARPHHFARRDAAHSAIAVDTRGEQHFGGSEVGGDHGVVILGGNASDEHLAELLVTASHISCRQAAKSIYARRSRSRGRCPVSSACSSGAVW